MLRAPRLVPLALLALVGGAALAGCTGDPGLAAQVGSNRYTERRIDDVQDDMRTKLQDAIQSEYDRAKAAGATPLPTTVPSAQVGVSREEIVSTYVLRDVCVDVAPKTGGQPVTPQQIAEVEGITPDATYATVRAELYGCLSRLTVDASTAPTEEELREVYDAGLAAGVITPDQTFEQIAPQIDGDQLRSALSQRRALAESADKLNVTVNPRYRPLEFPVLSFDADKPALTIPLGEPGSDVIVPQS